MTGLPEQLTKDEAIHLLRDGLAQALMEAVARYVIPIFWIASSEGRPFVINNGSAFMLDCGQGPFLVTANHVYRGYLEARQRYPDAVCILGQTRFDLDLNYLSADPAYDVATFRIDTSTIASLAGYANGKVVLTGSQASWPPPPPQIDSGVFFMGFPGDGRTMRPYRGNSLVEIDWLGYTALAVANGVSETDLTLIFDHEHNFDVGLRPTVPSDAALGGCSGAPILSFTNRHGVYGWQLGGVIYQSSQLILKASRADCLNPDGTLRTYPNPMTYRSVGVRPIP